MMPQERDNTKNQAMDGSASFCLRYALGLFAYPGMFCLIF